MQMKKYTHDDIQRTIGGGGWHKEKKSLVGKQVRLTRVRRVRAFPCSQLNWRYKMYIRWGCVWWHWYENLTNDGAHSANISVGMSDEE